MRSPHQLVHSRARLRPRYALFPLEGYPTSRIPAWDGCEVRVLASPAMGAAFAQYLMRMAAGAAARHAADGRIETFFYLLSGEAMLEMDNHPAALLQPGGFALVPPDVGFRVRARQAGEMLVLRKRHELAVGIEPFGPLIGNQAEVPAPPWMDNPHTRLQTLIPDQLQYDLAMNIFTFDPGFGLPYVETHVMEHGLYFLEGKGMYYLDGDWQEVEANDFLWLGPYCPQSFYATGPTPSKYIYCKNVNREIPL
jgi:(S)-ureidoglycine aminohydrolase